VPEGKTPVREERKIWPFSFPGRPKENYPIETLQAESGKRNLLEGVLAGARWKKGAKFLRDIFLLLGEERVSRK